MTAPSIVGFSEALAKLARIQAEIAVISASDDLVDWRRGLIALRRTLQIQIGELSKMINAIEDAETARPLRDAINRMRSKVALHQATWPAVRIDRADRDYSASVQEVRAANRDFLALADRLLTSRRDTGDLS